jgi:hypothetical protein
MLLEAEQVFKLNWRATHGRYGLTAKGFATLGVAPMEPWRRPPSDNLIAKITERTTRQMLAAEQRYMDQ